MTKVLQERHTRKDMDRMGTWDEVKGITQWEETILQKHLEDARQEAKQFLEGLDDQLREHSPAGWKVVGYRERTLVTLFGSVPIRRALYHDPQGKSHFLLDRALNWQPRVQATPALQLLLAQWGSDFSYRQVQQILAPYCQTPPSHATIQKRVTALGEARHREEEDDRRQLEENGALPARRGRKVASPLFIEADGVFISLQRAPQRKAEIKLAYAYEGKEPIGKGRFALVGKEAFAGLHRTADFWSGFLLQLDGRYDLTQVKQYVLGADGAHWTKQGMDYFTPALFQLDRRHLYQAIARATPLPHWQPLFQQATAGNLDAVLTTLSDLQAKAQEGRSEGRLEQLKGYLKDNADGLTDYRLRLPLTPKERQTLPGLGTVEGNIDKILARRFKRRGMSWSPEGAHRLAKILALRSNGTLADWIGKQRVHRPLAPEIRQRAQETLRRPWKRKGEEILRYDLPALYGPHADRPWVGVLRTLIGLQGIS
jgi:hypothetical protein